MELTIYALYALVQLAKLETVKEGRSIWVTEDIAQSLAEQDLVSIEDYDMECQIVLTIKGRQFVKELQNHKYIGN